MRVSEELALANVINPADYGSAGVDGKSVTAAKVHAVTFLFSFGALTGNSTLHFYNGATSGAKTTEVAFTYRLASAAHGSANADQFGDKIAVAVGGLLLVAATFANKQVVVEFDSDTVTDGQPWITPSIDAVATVLHVACAGPAYPRYPGHASPTVQ